MLSHNVNTKISMQKIDGELEKSCGLNEKELENVFVDLR